MTPSQIITDHIGDFVKWILTGSIAFVVSAGYNACSVLPSRNLDFVPLRITVPEVCRVNRAQVSDSLKGVAPAASSILDQLAKPSSSAIRYSSAQLELLGYHQALQYLMNSPSYSSTSSETFPIPSSWLGTISPPSVRPRLFKEGVVACGARLSDGPFSHDYFTVEVQAVLLMKTPHEYVVDRRCRLVAAGNELPVWLMSWEDPTRPSSPTPDPSQERPAIISNTGPALFRFDYLDRRLFESDVSIQVSNMSIEVLKAATSDRRQPYPASIRCDVLGEHEGALFRGEKRLPIAESTFSRWAFSIF